MRSPAPRPANRSFADPSDDILWSKLCTGATICSNFFRFILFKNCFLILSFCYTLLILLFLSLLILLVLFFLFLFFSSSAIVTHTHTHTQTKYPRQIYDRQCRGNISQSTFWLHAPPHSRQLAQAALYLLTQRIERLFISALILSSA